MRAARLTLAIAAAIALGAPASAGAVYFPGQQADGPSPDIVSLGGVTMARDGAGHVVYLKRDGGVNHVYVSFLANGSPREPRRLDTGQLAPSSEPRVSNADNGRAVAVWLNGGSLYASVRPSGSSDWGAPEVVYNRPVGTAAAAEPSLSMGPSGAAYVAFRVGGDLRVARLVRTSWTLQPEPLDIVRGRAVAQPSIATSADGTALAAWAEGGQVWARRVVRNRLSSVPREVSVPSLDGEGAGGADSPSVKIEDDSSYAWVAIRQDFQGGSRVFARRLVGSEFDSPVAIDGGIRGAETPDLDMTGRGRGLAGIGVRGTQATLGATINARDEWTTIGPLIGGSPRQPVPKAALAENGRGTVAWHAQNDAGQGAVRARYFNARRFEEQTFLSDPSLGSVDGSAGMDAAADSHGNQVIAYIQGEGAERRVMVAVFDRDPRAVGGRNFNKWTRKRSFRLKWSKVADTWGTVQYRIDVDGLPLTTTTRTSFPVRNLPDGAHVYNVVTIDARGQATMGPDRALYVDTTAPTATITAKRSKMGRPAKVTLDATDGEAIAGSGVARIRVRYGDGRGGEIKVPRIGIVEGAKLGYRYRKPGRYTVRAEIRDRAGNKRVVKTRVVVGR